MAVANVLDGKMALGIAFRAFFAALFKQDVAEQLRLVLDQKTPVVVAPTPTIATVAKPKASLAPTRSEAITLLAALQREARLIDLLQEDFGKYSDAQIGAAARPCLQQCSATLDRLVGLRAIESATEGQSITVSEQTTPARIQWLGEGVGTTGKLVHHGWEAARVELPKWSGTEADAMVIAPVQVQRT